MNTLSCWLQELVLQLPNWGGHLIIYASLNKQGLFSHGRIAPLPRYAWRCPVSNSQKNSRPVVIIEDLMMSTWNAWLTSTVMWEGKLSVCNIGPTDLNRGLWTRCGLFFNLVARWVSSLVELGSCWVYSWWVVHLSQRARLIESLPATWHIQVR